MYMKDIIIKWINNKNKLPLFVYGKTGNGKFTFLKNILKNYYSIKKYNYIDFLENKNINKLFEKKNKNVLSQFINKKDDIIIITELECLNIKNIKNIIKIIKSPLILIGSGKCLKIKNELDSLCKVLHYNKDFKHKTDKTIELYDNIKKILTEHESIDKVNYYYNLDKILFPLLIHENYKNYVIKNLKNKKDIYKCILEVSENIMFCDIINDYIFNNYLWNIQNLYSIIFCHYSSYIINKKYEKRKIIKYPKIEYTKILTKNSILFINFKQYKLILNNIKYNHNFDNMIINYITENILIYLLYDIENGIKYLLEYGFTKKDILKLIKFSNEYYFIFNNTIIKKTIEKNIKNYYVK
jgi:hypothetical protein